MSPPARLTIGPHTMAALAAAKQQTLWTRLDKASFLKHGKDGWMDAQTDGRTDECINGWGERPEVRGLTPSDLRKRCLVDCGWSSTLTAAQQLNNPTATAQQLNNPTAQPNSPTCRRHLPKFDPILISLTAVLGHNHTGGRSVRLLPSTYPW